MAFPAHGAPTTTADSAAVTSHTINLPTFSAGDRVIVISNHRDPGTYTLPVGWVQLESLTDQATTTMRMIAYYRDMQTGDGTTVVGTSAVAGKAASAAVRFAAGTFDGSIAPFHASAIGTSTNPDPPNLAPGIDVRDFAWQAAAGEVNQSTTISVFPLTGNNTRVPTTGGAGTSGCVIGYCDQDIAVASENPGTFTFSINQHWIALTIGVAPWPFPKGADHLPLVQNVNHLSPI